MDNGHDTLRAILRRLPTRGAVSACAWLAAVLVGAERAEARPFQSGPARLSEIVMNEAGLDTHEFIEVQAAPFASLAGHLLVIVDGDAQNAGVVDRVVDLGSQTMPASGYFVAGDTAVTPRDLDLGAFDRIENGTCTIYLVQAANPSAVMALAGTRIATSLTTTSLGTIANVLDLVAIADLDYPDADRVFDGATVLGPEGRLTPAGVFRCANAPMGWSSTYLDYDPLQPAVVPPTPGAANAPCDPGVPYCFGDGSGTACPCGNASAVGDGVGCLHSFGVGGKLRTIGTASLAADTVALVGTQLPDGPALYFQGTARMNGGAGIVFGDGLRCVAGSVVRLGTKFSVGATSQYPDVGDPSVSSRGLVVGPGTRTYQAWFRNSATFCTAATYNLTNGVEVQWVP